MQQDMNICRTCKHAHSYPKTALGDDVFWCDKVLFHLWESLDCNAPTLVLVRGERAGCLDFYERDQTEFNRVWAHELAALEAAEDEKQELLMFWGYNPTARSA